MPASVRLAFMVNPPDVFAMIFVENWYFPFLTSAVFICFEILVLLSLINVEVTGLEGLELKNHKLILSIENQSPQTISFIKQ